MDAVWITGFALLHAGGAVLCRSFGMDDSLLLTALTMALTIILCVREGMSVTMTAICGVLVNILGYGLGVAMAALLGLLLPSEVAVHALSTFIVTLLIGWGVLLTGRHIVPPVPDRPVRDNLGTMLLMVGLIFGVRIVVSGSAGISLFSDTDLRELLRLFLSNSVALLTMAFLTLLIVEYSRKLRERMDRWAAMTLTFLMLVALVALSALMVGLGLPLRADTNLSGPDYSRLLVIAVVLESLLFSVIYLVDSAISARRNARYERDSANQAHSQYLSLKQQVSPHFLFNSLNVLDSLITEGPPEAAHEYIGKLSGLYRYMLRDEREPVVRLRDELEYSRMYYDLLLVRFPDGLTVRSDIRPEDQQRLVVKYSVQMLIENAVKHNAVDGLVIHLTSDGESICVSNNRVPRLNPPVSAGLGLKYIRNSYLGSFGKDITITQTDSSYTVRLPLLSSL